MNLAKKLLNNPGLIALCVPEEIIEIKAVSGSSMPIVVGPIKLRRTFNQSDGKGGFTKFWRIICPGHPRNDSDLSFEGLKEAGIVRWF